MNDVYILVCTYVCIFIVFMIIGQATPVFILYSNVDPYSYGNTLNS
uniref:Uncharacterized protein n=2 Tax=Anguilla anguilla TaxID=7936 RepID=A0A0E9VU74_ANGAN